MKKQIYKHPNETSRLTLKRKSENIATFKKIDEPKEYKAGIDKWDYPVMICDIKNVSVINTKIR